MTAREQRSITWTRAKLQAFEMAMNRAHDEGLKTFRYENHEFLVTYARYLIEYLRGKGLG